MIYTITLNPALDYVMDFSKEKKIKNWARASNTNLVAGGKGVNASQLLKNIGVHSKALIFSGGTTGQILRDKLTKDNIDFVNFETNCNTRINVKAQFDETYEFQAEGLNQNSKITKELLNFLETNLNPEDIVLIMGSKMKNLPEDILESISEIIIGKRAKVVYDIASKEMLKLLKYKPLLIKPNKSEVKEIFGLKEDPTNVEIEESGKKLLAMGAQNVIISNAEHGALLFTNKNVYKANPIRIVQKNGSGAGDSMVAGFVYKFIETNDYQQALDFSNACGAATASSEGIASKEQIQKLTKI